MPQQVFFDTEDYDLKNEYDNDTSTFTPKKNGYYNVMMQAKWAAEAGGDLTIDYTINDNETLGVETYFDAGIGNVTQVFYDTTYLLKGDNVTFHAKTNAGNTVLAGTRYTYIAITRAVTCLTPILSYPGKTS